MKKKMTIIPEPKEQPKPTPPPPPPTPPQPPKQPGEYSKDNGVLFMDKEFNQDNCMPLVKITTECSRQGFSRWLRSRATPASPS